jgi:E3 ubiquitin-protein ligase UBR7
MAGTTEANMSPPPASAASMASSDAPVADPTQNNTPFDSAASGASNAVAAASAGGVEAAQGEGQAEDEEEDGEEVVTLHEVLREQSELNDAAEAVLGDASDEHCSYELGYLRQALYACLTCTPGPLESGNVAGVCLACSYHCHGDHELVELYTKREFRCDCGNARFPDTARPCALLSDKHELNDRNVYSHNFVGTYCSCARPYPDPERTAPEVMVQCIVCEDWLHEEHIYGAETQRALPDAFDELICQACMTKHPYLAAYQLLEHQDYEDQAVDEAAENGAASTASPSSVCVLEKLQQRLAQKADNAVIEPTFWSREWRTRLCHCAKCVARMEKQKIAFLMDSEDTLQAYEERAKQQQQQINGTSQSTGAAATPPTTTTTQGDDPIVSSSVETAMSTMEEAAQRAFQSKLSHEQQVEMAVGYNHMKEKLQSYLATFAASGKTVRAQDIQEFFTELRESKRPRLN